jgi:hypothetical protein
VIARLIHPIIVDSRLELATPSPPQQQELFSPLRPKDIRKTQKMDQKKHKNGKRQTTDTLKRLQVRCASLNAYEVRNTAQQLQNGFSHGAHF